MFEVWIYTEEVYFGAIPQPFDSERKARAFCKRRNRSKLGLVYRVVPCN